MIDLVTKLKLVSFKVQFMEGWVPIICCLLNLIFYDEI